MPPEPGVATAEPRRRGALIPTLIVLGVLGVLFLLFVVAGGVGANRLLRREMAERFPGEVFYPRMAYCTDNGAMIAVAGALRLADARPIGEIRAQARWALDSLAAPAGSN